MRYGSRDLMANSRNCVYRRLVGDLIKVKMTSALEEAYELAGLPFFISSTSSLKKTFRASQLARIRSRDLVEKHTHKRRKHFSSASLFQNQVSLKSHYSVCRLGIVPQTLLKEHHQHHSNCIKFWVKLKLMPIVFKTSVYTSICLYTWHSQGFFVFVFVFF